MAINRSRVDKVYEQVRTMATNFEFKPDERINEGALAGELGTSRTPLREALNRLVAEGSSVARSTRIRSSGSTRPARRSNARR